MRRFVASHSQQCEPTKRSNPGNTWAERKSYNNGESKGNNGDQGPPIGLFTHYYKDKLGNYAIM